MSSQQKRRKRQLLERDGIRIDNDEGHQIAYIFRCYLCLEVFNPSELEIEHKTPRSRGGPNSLSNLGLSCEPCNSDKGNMTEVEYREFKALLAQYQPTNVEAAKSGFTKYQGRRRLNKARTVLTHALSEYWPDEQDPDANR